MTSSMPLRLYFIRHGETEWSLSGQYTGRADVTLTAHGEEEARELAPRLRNIPFAHVLTSPLKRAQQTCALAGFGASAALEPDLTEWDNGDDEGRTPADIFTSRPGWNLFRDGSLHGETPTQISDRADRLITRLRALNGNVALFSHSHFGRVLAARWIGLSVEWAQHLSLSTASLSILCYEHHRTDQPAIALWNSTAHDTIDPASGPSANDAGPTKQQAFERWENEGGEIPEVQRTPCCDRSVGPPSTKRLIVFDLDGTLAESKSALDTEMAALLGALLKIVKVAVSSGGDWPQFKKQVLSNLPHDERLDNLSLLPTCGTKFYQYAGDWKKIYSEDFDVHEKEKITKSLKQATESAGIIAAKVWGEQVEDRGSQITFSALGQQAPIEEKKQWDLAFTKRKTIKARLDQLIPEFSVHLGGTTSIDVTKPGIDKAYGIRKLRDTLGIAIEEMIFIGDALFPGGNDYPAKEAGVLSIQVRDPNETKRVVEAILACLSGVQVQTLRKEES